jgi:hypothetical protein
MLSTFDFFYKLGAGLATSVTNFSLHPSPPSFEVAVVTADLKMNLAKKHCPSIFRRI